MPKINHVAVSPALIPLLFTNSNEFWRWPEDPTKAEPEYPFSLEGNPDLGTDDYKQIMIDPSQVIVETQPKVRVEDSGLSDAAIKQFADALAENGQITPILLRVFKTHDSYVDPADPSQGTNPGEFQYHLVAGLRRVLAAREIMRRQQEQLNAEIAAGKPVEERTVVEFNLLAVVRVVSSEEVAKQLAISENVNREQMSALETYFAYKPYLDGARRENGQVNVTKAAEAAGIGKTTMAVYDRIDSLYGKEGEEEFTAMFNSGQFNFDVAAELSKLTREERNAKLIAAKGLISQKVMAKATKAAKAAQEAVLANPTVAALSPEQAQAIADQAAKAAADQVHAGAVVVPGKTTDATITKAILDAAPATPGAALPAPTAKKMSVGDLIKLLEQELNPAIVSAQVVAWKGMLVNRLQGNFGPDMDNAIIRGLLALFHPAHIVETVVTPAAPKGPVAPKGPAKAAPIAPPPAPAAVPVGPAVAPAPPVPPRRPAKV